jgi:hypothetical protein
VNPPLNLYQTAIAQPGRGPLFWMLLALLVTFALTRIVTRRIRAGSATLKNWQVGGLHVHHQVFGLMLILVSGCLEFAYRPPAPWIDVLGALFGIGMSLTLDEFALLLYLDDVYWSPEGRRSIDAVFLAAVLTALLLVGVTPLDLSGLQHELLASIALVLVVNLVVVTICFLKGKPVLGIVGLLVPVVALIGSIRLAKPTSPWAAWRYPPDSARRRKAARRFGAPYQARWNWLRDLVGGAPNPLP